MRAVVREVFAAAAPAYGRENPLLTVERPETAALLPDLGGKTVLDLGAGPGHYAALATARGARLALALDLTPAMAKRSPRPAIVADAVRLPLRDGSVDVIVAALVVSFVASRRSLFEESARVLRSGGTFVLSDLHAVASRRGWRRSFEGATGERVVIEAPPAEAELLCAEIRGAGLTVDRVREPAVDERLEEQFDRAGRRDFESLRGTPLLSLLRAHKGRIHVS